MDAWQETVQNMLIKEPMIKEAAEKNKSLRAGLVDILFTTGKNAFTHLMAEFTVSALKCQIYFAEILISLHFPSSRDGDTPSPYPSFPFRTRGTNFWSIV